jgi:hypothetical protein
MLILNGKKLFLFMFLTIFLKSPLLSIGEYFLGQIIPYPVSETNRVVFNIERDPVFASRLIVENSGLWLRLFSNETLTFNDSAPLKYVIASSTDSRSNDLKNVCLGVGITDQSKLDLKSPLVIQYNTDPSLPAELWSNSVKIGFAAVYNGRNSPFPVWVTKNLDAVNKINLENSIQAAIAKKDAEAAAAAAVGAARRTATDEIKILDDKVKASAAEKLKQEEIIRAQDKANASTKKILIGTSAGLGVGVVAAGGIGYGLWRRRKAKKSKAAKAQTQASRQYPPASRNTVR